MMRTTPTRILTEALRAIINDAEGLERELVQAQNDVERIARENSELCDDVHALREQLAELHADNVRLRAELQGAETVTERKAS